MFSLISKGISYIATVVVAGVMLMNISAFAAADSAVTPPSANTSLATPYYFIDVQTCVELFDWKQYVADIANGINETSPFIKKGCIRQEKFASNGSKTITKDANDAITSISYTNTGQMKINVPQYKDFNGNSNTTAKEVLGSMPVIGISPNGGQNAQNLTAFDITGASTSKPVCDRVLLESLTQNQCIWTEGELSQIYSPQTARTGAPRIVDTGVDQIYRNEAGKLQYNGGPCYTQNGQMVARTKIDVGGPRERDASTLFTDAAGKSTLEQCRFFLTGGEKNTSMSVNCGSEPLKGNTSRTYMAIDQGLCAYQFLYVIDLPTAQECKTYWNIDTVDYEEYCLNFWRKRFQGLHNNTMTGNRFVIAKTYYGMFADSSFKCQTVGQTNCNQSYKFSHNGEWRNPDVNGPRKTFTTNATREQLLNFFGNSQDVNQLTTAQLKIELEGMVQAMDGGSTYVF